MNVRVIAVAAALSVLLFFLPRNSVADEITGSQVQIDQISYLIDFSDYSAGSIDNWLAAKGFKFERDAKDRRKLDFDVSSKSLILEAKKPLHAILLNERVDLQAYSKVIVEWGVIGIIDQYLNEDRTSHHKQHHTAKRIFERLREEHGFDGGYTIVKDYVREHRRRRREMFVPLVHPPGHAQADFGEADAVIAGVRLRAH